MAWTRIAEFVSLDEAYIVKGMLEANDIPVVVNNATLASVYPLTDTWTPIEILVPENMACKAKDLMNVESD